MDTITPKRKEKPKATSEASASTAQLQNALDGHCSTSPEPSVALTVTGVGGPQPRVAALGVRSNRGRPVR